MPGQLLTGLFFSAVISLISFRFRLLTAGGSIAQGVLGTILLGLGGWEWTVPMVTFFILSNLLSKVGRDRRSPVELYFEKPSRRDSLQVMANGGIAGAVTLIWFFTGAEGMYVAQLGAVAAATADTWGTELGTLSRSLPFLITSFRKVEAGRSGAVSVVGILAGIAGSLVIFASAVPWIPSPLRFASLVAVVGAGIIGTLVDSLLGATVQVQYECMVCKKTTERLHHCGAETTALRGWRWIRNDEVNLICTISGAVSAYFISVLL